MLASYPLLGGEGLSWGCVGQTSRWHWCLDSTGPWPGEARPRHPRLQICEQTDEPGLQQLAQWQLRRRCEHLRMQTSSSFCFSVRHSCSWGSCMATPGNLSSPGAEDKGTGDEVWQWWGRHIHTLVVETHSHLAGDRGAFHPGTGEVRTQVCRGERSAWL